MTTAQTLTQACPLNDGLAVLDQMMAELWLDNEPHALDLALDLRGALHSQAPAETVIEIFFALRHIVEERHYLPSYRLRRWLQGRVQAWVRVDRRQAAVPVSINLDPPSLNSLREKCYASIDLAWQPGATVHFEYIGNSVI